MLELTPLRCEGGLELGACLGVKSIGKPCAGKPHARFDEGGQAKVCSLLYPIPLSDIVGNVNRSLRGWANYFHYRNSSQAMNKVRKHAEDRLRTHLMQRHKVKDRRIGFGRFPSTHLYGRYGLYKVPMKAGWNSAHALA